MSLPPCPRDNCTAPGHHYHMASTGDVMGYGPIARIDCPEIWQEAADIARGEA